MATSFYLPAGRLTGYHTSTYIVFINVFIIFMIFLKFIDGSGLIYTNVSDAFEHQTYQTSPLNSVILELFEWQSGIQTRHPVTCRDVPL